MTVACGGLNVSTVAADTTASVGLIQFFTVLLKKILTQT